MKLFYLILAHANLHQVDRMINALRHEHAEFLIHLDGRVPPDDIERSGFYGAPKVTVIKERYNITWGGYNMVRATLSLMKAACQKKEPGYLILLSGQDFPVKSPEVIYDFLLKNYGREYLEHFPLPDVRWSPYFGLDRMRFHWFIDALGLDASYEVYELQKNKDMTRPYFEDFPPYGGSQWWCITTECATYILKFLRSNRLYEEFFQTCLNPDEIFFNTLVLNSPFKEKTVNNNLKYIVWTGGPHPRILTMYDWEPIMQSENLWARKFDDVESASILDQLEKHINENSPTIIP
ncbi:beta-1,6-N-acetylglucosaminyltransferase [Longitalea luteola]|uniref:beta-1,6-N-acetylglucosaminyltransferase n=1 Tax=Longitalea luteola TaxID=2812563 RepID=UPI001A96E4AB|nr:beta-1,6-N-acetylglucosaminyltransferase [Longitalea luteola]